MKEPILSREEVEALAHRICARYIHSENIHLRQYTFGITTLEQLVDAILEKLCGEPRDEVTGEVIPWGRILELGDRHGMQWAGKTGWRFESDDPLYAFANDVARYAIAAARTGASS